jgi:hypothetical protein
VHCAVYPPSHAVTVIIAEPAPAPVTVAFRPLPLTLATLVLLLDHVTALSVASEG